MTASASAFEQGYTPVADSLAMSFWIAVVPVLLVFVLLGALRVKVHVAAAAGLSCGFVLAVVVWQLPLELAVASGLMGVAVALVPMLWTLIAAVWLMNLLNESGYFEVLKESMGYLTHDRRLQALLVGFGFNGLLEGLVAIGSPIAIIAAMLAGLGFPPLIAAMVALLGDAHPGVWGPMGLPVLVMELVTDLDPNAIGAMAGRQTPILAILVAPVIILVVSGWRGFRDVWWVTVACGLAFAAGTFIAANYISFFLAGIVGALAAIATLLVVLAFWRPRSVWRFPGETLPVHAAVRRPASSIIRAWSPIAILVGSVVIATGTPLRATLARASRIEFTWPALDGQVVRTPPVVADPGVYPAVFVSELLLVPGTLVVLTAFVSMWTLRISPGRAVGVLFATLRQLRTAILTTVSVLALAYIMNYSGIALTIGLGFASAGVWFPAAAVLLGLVGSGIAGTNTASNALFGNLVAVGGAQAGIDPVLAAGSLGSGGNMGKAIAPSALTLATGAAKIQGSEGLLLRRLIGISLALTVVVAVIAMAQHHLVSWMVP